MGALRNSTVLRKPLSGGARTWNQADRVSELSLETRYSNSDGKDMRLSFTMSASGGYTNIRVYVDTKDYADILKAMCDVDRETTMAAMAVELARQLSVVAPQGRGGVER